MPRNDWRMYSPKLSQILVIEDEDDDSYLLTRQIARAQIDDHVRVIRDGREAIDVLFSTPFPPMAIFLDLHLRGISGLEVLKKLKGHPRLKEIPVIIMTGSTNPFEFEQCMQLGVTAFLSKPVRLATFIKTVAHLYPKALVPK